MSGALQRIYSGAPWESKAGYCRAVRAGNLIAVAGTTAVTEDGGVHAPGDPYQQTKRILEIIENALTQLGAARQRVIRTRMFVTDISRWQEVARAHGEFFAASPPASTMVEVKGLINPDLLVEIEADAVVDS